MRRHLCFFGLAAFAITVFAGCSKPTMPTVGERLETSGLTPDARTRPSGRFVASSNNPYFPLVPGTTFLYRSETDEGIETQEVRVTTKTKRILGITTRVVEDIVRLDGAVTEHTFDWYAQDERGNVWYFGEDSKELDPETGEVVSTAGSWEAGRNGAEAGIIMKARPRVGDTYSEENAPGVAEDKARVLSLSARVKVPYGRFKNCLQTENFTPLEPDLLENKFYAPGVGLVREVDVAGGGTENVLVKVKRPRKSSSRDLRISVRRAPASSTSR